MNELANEKTMTIKEVAEIFNVSEDTILRKVKEYFPGIVRNGKTTYLSELQITKIKIELEKNYSINLRNGQELPVTDLEMLLLSKKVDLWKDQKITELQKENEIMKPKALFYDAVTDSKDAIEMKNVAKVINHRGYGRNNLFEFLRSNNILDKNNQPYQQYIDREYFRVVETKYEVNGDIKINLKTLVFQKGIDFIIKLLKVENI